MVSFTLAPPTSLDRTHRDNTYFDGRSWSSNVSKQLEPIETAVIAMFLRGDHLVLKSLMIQLHVVTVHSRQRSEAGFYTDFTIPDDIPSIPGKDSFVLSDVVGEIEGLQNGAGFALFIRGGKLAFLEGFSYDEPWPSTVLSFNLKYMNGEKRDFEALSKILGGSDVGRCEGEHRREGDTHDPTQ